MATEIKKEIIADVAMVTVQDRDGDMNALRCAIIDHITSRESREGCKVMLMINLDTFSAISSTFFGALGASIQEQHVQIVALCGMHTAVQRRAEQFGIRDGGAAERVRSDKIQEAAKKFRFFNSLQEAEESLSTVVRGN